MKTISNYAILPNSGFDSSKPSITFFDYHINGEYNNIGAYLKWNTFHHFSLEDGGFLSVLYGYHSRSKEIIYGYNWTTCYDITNKLQLNI